MVRLERYKFRTQLYIYFILVIGLVIVCMWVTLYFVLGTSYEKRENQVLTNQARQIAINVDNRLDYYQSYMNLILADKQFTDKMNTKSFYEIKEYLKELTGEFMQLNAGRISEINIYEMEDEGRSKALESGDFIFSETYLNNRNEKVFSIIKNIYQGKADRGYLLEFRIYESEIFSFFNEDKSGNLIYIKNGEKIMSMSERKNFLEKLQSGRKEKAEENQAKEMETKIPVSAYCQNGWETLIYTDTRYLNRGLFEVLRQIIPAVVFIVTCTVCVVMYISNQLNTRVGILQKKIMAIGRDWAEGETEVIEGADEFKLLGDEIDHTRLHIIHLLQEIEDKNASRRIAEMVALRAQINSHFLFNTLASIKWLSRSGDSEDILSEAIERLAVFLRYSISTEEDKVPLAREAEQLEAYIYLQRLRYGDELNVVMDIEEELLECYTVKLILQPLVENAIFHGRREDGSVLNITVYSYYEVEYYYLVVEDDGNGITDERIQMVMEGNVEAADGGYGLRNVISRIDICTGGEGGLAIESELDRYTKIVVRQRR